MSQSNRNGDARESLAAPAPAGEADAQKGGPRGFRAVGAAVLKLAAPVIAKRGGGILARLKAEWAAVVGCDWAAACWPAALGRDGALTLRVASAAAALELQHRAPLVIERINLYLGRAAVTRLKLVQGPLPLATQSHPPPPRLLGAREAAALDDRLAAVASPELRAALARLGRAVLAAEPEAGGIAREPETD